MRPGEIAAALNAAEEGGRTWQPRNVAAVLRGRTGRLRDPDPRRSPQLLASGEGKWRNMLQLRPWMPPEKFDALSRAARRRIAAEGEAVIACGRSEAVTLPVAVSRMLPEQADIVEATLTVSRIAGHYDAALSVTAVLPDPAQHEDGAMVALHAGWRRRSDGAVRVAVYASTAPLAVPDRLRHVIDPVTSRQGEIVVPAAWMDRAGYPAGVRGIRDILREPVQSKVADWLDTFPQPNGPTGSEVRNWRSPLRLDALTLAWRATPPTGVGAGEITGLLEEWRKRNRHLWEIESNDRDQLTRRRDNTWRLVARLLSAAAATLVVDSTDLASLRRRSDDADIDPALLRTHERKARARAALSAPGKLRRLAVNAARRAGAAVTEVDSSGFSRTCPHCGNVATPHPRYAAYAVVTCPACQRSYDQDHAAAALMLDRAAGDLARGR